MGGEDDLLTLGELAEELHDLSDAGGVQPILGFLNQHQGRWRQVREREKGEGIEHAFAGVLRGDCPARPKIESERLHPTAWTAKLE